MRPTVVWAVVALAGLAAAAPAPRESIEGVWRGTSVCVDRSLRPDCDDERVVYEFRPLAGATGVVRLEARHVVGGTAETMYILDVRYLPERKAWVSEFVRMHARGAWSFVVEGDALHGRLVDLPSGTLRRKVELKRGAPSSPGSAPPPPSAPPSPHPPARPGS